MASFAACHRARTKPESGNLTDLARPDVAKALLTALGTVNTERATLYSDVVFAALPAGARATLEAMMSTGTYEYQSEFVRRYVFQGRAEGRAAAVLDFLEARGIDVPDDARACIAECTDIEQIDAWVRRAATANSIDDLFR